MNEETLKRLEKIEKRLKKLEIQEFQDTLTLVEMLSNISFFGNLKKKNCKFAKQEQCSFFLVKGNLKKTIPLATECKIHSCEEKSSHCHIELCNATCAICPVAERIFNLPEERTPLTR